MCTFFCAKMHSFLCKKEKVVFLTVGDGISREIWTLLGKLQEKA